MNAQHDKVLGILMAKDLLHFYTKNQDCDLSNLMRPAMFVPESQRLQSLLKQFKVQHNHMAIVFDEHDVPTGLVTLEDIIEQIVGNIEDEHDSNTQIDYIQKVNDNNYIVNGLTKIDHFNKYFDISIDDKDFDTIGGLVAQKFGYLPKRGETIQLLDLQLKILNVTQRRIKSMRIHH